MNAQEFVACWKREKDDLLAAFTAEDSPSGVAKAITRLALTPLQHTALIGIVDSVLTDTMYTLLLGLDGAASIGGIQSPYRLIDEDGRVIAAPGALEEEAHRQFHEPQAPPASVL